MASARTRWGILLVAAGTLLPAGLAAGVFLVTRISFEAISGGPVSPARGSFTFLTEMDPFFVLTGPVFDDEPTSLISVRLNFGNYTINDVGARCEDESQNCIIPAGIGGIVNGIGADHLGENGIGTGVDDFHLGLSHQYSDSERAGFFEYVFADGRGGSDTGTALRWCAAGSCWEKPQEGDRTLTLEIEQFTIEISPD